MLLEINCTFPAGIWNQNIKYFKIIVINKSKLI